jgi:hypothetical protein
VSEFAEAREALRAAVADKRAEPSVHLGGVLADAAERLLALLDVEPDVCGQPHPEHFCRKPADHGDIYHTAYPSAGPGGSVSWHDGGRVSPTLRRVGERVRNPRPRTPVPLPDIPDTWKRVVWYWPAPDNTRIHAFVSGRALALCADASNQRRHWTRDDSALCSDEDLREPSMRDQMCKECTKRAVVVEAEPVDVAQ